MSGKRSTSGEIRRLVESGHFGEVVAIDVGSGSYALGKNAIDASESLRKQRRDAQVWLTWVGHRTLYQLWGQFPAEDRVIVAW